MLNVIIIENANDYEPCIVYRANIKAVQALIVFVSVAGMQSQFCDFC